MPRGVKARARAEYITISVATGGWLVTVEDDDRKRIVFTDLGELLGYLEEELEVR